MTLFKDKNGNLSSKRIIGAAMTLYVLIMLTFAIAKDVDFKDNVSGLMNTILYAGGALLGIGVLENKK